MYMTHGVALPEGGESVNESRMVRGADHFIRVTMITDPLVRYQWDVLQAEMSAVTGGDSRVARVSYNGSHSRSSLPRFAQ